jgi:hypothetical protein
MKPHSGPHWNYAQLTFPLLRTEGCKSVLVDHGAWAARSWSSVVLVTEICLRVFVVLVGIGCWKEALDDS